MVDVTVLPAFVAVILAFLVPPGPDMAFMLAVGLERGRAAAVRAILGIGTGMTVYAAAVVLGVASMAERAPILLDVVKVLGAAYLLWLAWHAFRAAHRPDGSSANQPTAHAYWRGVIVSLTNPKVILFFLAVLPQFVGEAESTTAQLAMLGVVNVAMEVLLYGAIGVLAGAFQARFANSRRGGVVLHTIAGIVYTLLACFVLAEVVARLFSL